jgi:hypothetical protein
MGTGILIGGGAGGAVGIGVGVELLRK